MIRYCPSCKTERSLTELFCEGDVQGTRCEWSLSDEPLRQTGWRQPVLVTEEAVQSIEVASGCTAGHPMAADDFICMTCGLDRASESGSVWQAQPALQEVSSEAKSTQNAIQIPFQITGHSAIFYYKTSFIGFNQSKQNIPHNDSR